MSRHSYWYSAICALLLMSFSNATSAEQAGEALAHLGEEGAVISDVGGHVVVRVPLSQSVPWRAHTLDGPPRLVVDFSELEWSAKPDVLSGSVVNVNAGVYRAGWYRLVRASAQGRADDHQAPQAPLGARSSPDTVGLRGP